MAITGTFKADFSEFDDAAHHSLGELQKWEQETNKVGLGVDRMVATSAASLRSITGASNDFGTSLVSAADVAQQSFQKLPSVFSEVRAGLNETAAGAGLTVESLGLLGAAGIAVGVGYESWKIGRAIAEFFELDDTIAHSTATLMGWGDAAKEAAGARADVLAKASKAVGYAVTDMNLAMDINQRVFDDWNDGLLRARGPEESRLQIEHWNQELDKVVKAGVLAGLTRDIQSHDFSVKELAENYRISTGAVAFFTKELKADGDAAKAWAKEQTDAAKQTAAAHKAENEAALAEMKIMDEFRQDAHKRQVEIIRIQTDAQTKAAGIVNAAVLAELDAQVKLNAEWGLNASGAIALQHTALDSLNIAMATLHQKKAEGIDQTKQEQVLIDAYTKQLYDEAVARDRTAAATVGQIAAIRGVTDAYWAQVDAAAAAAGVVVIGHRPGEGGGINTGGSPNTSTGFSLGGPFSLTTPLPVASHKDGGPVNEGPAYLHDNEYVVPKDGALVMGGRGVTVHNVFNIVDTADNIARRTADLILRSVKQGTKLSA